MADIFISYSRKNKACVRRVYQALTDLDYDVWLDERNLEIGDDWMDRIGAEIRACSVFMLFWSEPASQSKYVRREINIAYRKADPDNDFKIVIYKFDDTPLLEKIEHVHYALLSDTCTDDDVRKLIDKFDTNHQHLRRFNDDKPLDAQVFEPVPDTPLVRVRYASNDVCTAYIVGPRDGKRPRSPEALPVCLQFFQTVDNNMLEPVYKAVGTDWMLLITGPESQSRPGNYGLENDQPVQWEASRAFIVDTVKRVAVSGKTTLQFFTLTPNALLGAVTLSFYRFWQVQFYNWTGGQNASYVQVMDIPPNQT